MVFQDGNGTFDPPSLVKISARFLAANMCLLPIKVPENKSPRSKQGHESTGRFKLQLFRISRRKSSKKITTEHRHALPPSMLEMVWQEALCLQQGIDYDDVYRFLNETRLYLDLRHCKSPVKNGQNDGRSSLTRLLNRIPQYSPNLTHLNLSYQQHLPADFSFLSQLVQLESLKCDYVTEFDCKKIQSVADSVAPLHYFKILSLRGCFYVEDDALGYLCRKLQRLEVLDLRETQPDGWNFLADARHFRLLQHEHLLNGLSQLFRESEYDYTDALPIYKNEHVKYEPDGHPLLITYHLHIVFPHLVKLELLQICFQSQSLESIRQLASLKELTLTADRMMAAEESLMGVMDSCGSNLELLRLSKFSWAVPLETVAQRCPNLKTLRLEHCRFRPSDDSRSASFQQASHPQQPYWNQLEYLELTAVPVRMDSMADWVLLMPASLQRCVLCFVGNVNIDDRFLELLPSIGMKYLALIGARQLTDKGVENLIVRFRHQQGSKNKLVISDCNHQIRQRRAELEQIARDNRVHLFLH
ncbi:uncharacterized protein LOC124190136 [Daphnia pulex]|uniref:uncharacterized protein LOC124190136 n=1 Tax=Daphnia pulex TaxID=6669 RepID=UPI001EE107FF|nr:uncharacterized protein LOC124190136 [Daphnia pulex]